MKKIFKFILWVLGIILLFSTVAIIAFYQPDIPVSALKGQYTNSQSAFIQVKGMQVHYRDEGPANDSMPLVLLHGTGAFLQTWDACTAEWVKNHRVIRMDIPAFGLTGPAPDDDYSIGAYVDFLYQFLEKLGINRFYLAGNSLGGQIAVAYAATHPAAVQKLILLDAAGYPMEHSKGNLAFNLARTPVLKHLLKIVTPAFVVRKSLEDVYGNKALVTDSLVKIYREMACREGNRNALVLRLNNPQSGDTTLVKEVQVPTLIIWGDQDFLIPLANAYKFQRDLPISTLAILKNIGHVPMEESPAQVALLIKDFIE